MLGEQRGNMTYILLNYMPLHWGSVSLGRSKEKSLSCTESIWHEGAQIWRPMKCQSLKIRPERPTLTFYPTYIRSINLITDLRHQRKRKRRGLGRKTHRVSSVQLLKKNWVETRRRRGGRRRAELAFRQVCLFSRKVPVHLYGNLYQE